MRNLSYKLTVVCDAPDEVFKRDSNLHKLLPCRGWKRELGEDCWEHCSYCIDHFYEDFGETSQCID